MKKLILVLLASFPAIAYGAGAGGINITPRPSTSSGGVVGNSTTTLTLKVGGGVSVATIGACAVPGACYSVGVDSIIIIGIWADAYAGSTVSVPQGWTRIDTAFSTGGVNGQPVSYRAPVIALTTATGSGQSTYSGYVSTRIPVNAFETFGVQVTTVPQVGRASQDLKVHFDYFTMPRF